MKTHDIAPDELQLDQIFQGGVIRFVLLDQVNATVTGHEHQLVTDAGILSVIFARQLLGSNEKRHTVSQRTGDW